MPEYLKQAPWYSAQVTEQVRATVAEMLSEIERDRNAAIRRYSEQLDDWAPESFVVDAGEIEAAGESLGHRHLPVATVGAYVPGGRYPMLASSFMTIVVPKVAGVDRVIACAPPHAGKGIHPAMLHAMARTAR